MAAITTSPPERSNYFRDSAVAAIRGDCATRGLHRWAVDDSQVPDQTRAQEWVLVLLVKSVLDANLARMKWRLLIDNYLDPPALPKSS